jgi:uncharacterized protein YndB with AHSA1/START domain
MKRKLLIVIGVIAVALLLMAGAGLFLPGEHHAASRITIGQPAESVWAVVGDPGALQGIWPELTRAERLPDRGGKPVWQEEVDGFTMTMVVEEAIPPSRLVTRIDSPPDAAFGGTWTYQLQPASTGTTVTVTEDGWIANPLFRVLGALAGLHGSLDGYLTALGNRFGEPVTPEHLP